MKKYLSSFIMAMCFFLMFGLVGSASASTAIPKIFVDGSQLYTDVDPVITEGTTLVPLAVLSSGLGYNVTWDNSLKQVTVKDSAITITLSIGNKLGLVGNESYELLQPPSILKGRTMVPLRFVTEILGFSLDWKQAEKEIYLASPIKEPVATNPPSTVIQTATISNVTIDEQSTIHISYTGTMTDPATMLLSSPSRLVIDLSSTGYTSALANGFIAGQTEITLNGYEHLTGYRYSLFSNDPLKARFVVLLQDQAVYSVSKTDSEVTISFGDNAEIPIPTPTPVPTPTPSPTAPPASDGNYHIVLDAGHGNQDPGAINYKLGLSEKTFNLNATLKLKAELEKVNNVKVYLTRSNDTYLTLDERVKFAENIPGVGRKADLFISIHANSIENNDSVNGTETYYSRADSKAFAEIIHSHMISALGLRDRGVKTAGWRVTKATTMPAILLEAGFLSNEKDAKTIFDENVQKKLAVEITKGIKQYLKL